MDALLTALAALVWVLVGLGWVLVAGLAIITLAIGAVLFCVIKEGA